MSHLRLSEERCLPFMRGCSHAVALLLREWQINGIASWLSGTPFTIGRDNGLLQQQGGSQTINVTGNPRPGFGEAGPDDPVRHYRMEIRAESQNVLNH